LQIIFSNIILLLHISCRYQWMWRHWATLCCECYLHQCKRIIQLWMQPWFSREWFHQLFRWVYETWQYYIYVYYCTSGRAVQENIRFEAGSIGPTVGRANTKAENQIFSCTAQPKECNNIFIIWPSTSFFDQWAWE